MCSGHPADLLFVALNCYQTLFPLQISPHILIFWRPDINSFKAYILKKAAPGAKVTPGTVATLLPNIKDREKGAGAFKMLSSSLDDDSDAYNFLCPMQTEASLSSSWASVNGTGFENITGSTNTMQASECDEHCNWNEVRRQHYCQQASHVLVVCQ